MVNVDEEAFLETLEQRALDAVAFEQNDGAVPREVRGDSIGMNDAIGEGKALVDTRDAIVHDDFGIFAHDAQNLAAGEGRADAVSVGPGMRGHNEAAARPNFS